MCLVHEATSECRRAAAAPQPIQHVGASATQPKHAGRLHATAMPCAGRKATGPLGCRNGSPVPGQVGNVKQCGPARVAFRQAAQAVDLRCPLRLVCSDATGGDRCWVAALGNSWCSSCRAAQHSATCVAATAARPPCTARPPGAAGGAAPCRSALCKHACRATLTTTHLSRTAWPPGAAGGAAAFRAVQRTRRATAAAAGRAVPPPLLLHPRSGAGLRETRACEG